MRDARALLLTADARVHDETPLRLGRGQRVSDRAALAQFLGDVGAARLGERLSHREAECCACERSGQTDRVIQLRAAQFRARRRECLRRGRVDVARDGDHAVLVAAPQKRGDHALSLLACRPEHDCG